MPKLRVPRIAKSIVGSTAGNPPPTASSEAPILPGDPARISPGTRAVGVIFVHGIGTQPARETFLNWSNSIVEMLAEWRREHDEAHPCDELQMGENPVQTGAVECGDGCDERAWARIAIPAADGHPATTWLLTEAYWAGTVRAPGFGQALGYLRSHIRAIIHGIANGYGLRETRRAERNAEIIREQPEPWDTRVAREVEELRRSDSLRWRWIDWLDQVWQGWLVRRILAAVATVASVATLAFYAPLRAIPIKAIQDRAELAMIDAQVVDAFGDLPVLLDDPVQSAIIRQRLASTIEWVRERGCDDVVVIAHSGGAIVSFATLLDPAYQRLPVAKLMTLGQGLALGWRLERASGPFVVGNPIRGDLGAARPGLRWVDFWASYDPAPAGPFEAVEGTPLLAVASVDPTLPPSPIQIESRPITNYMHMARDHDGYWRNDEGFLVPLIRHIDDPHGDGSGSRFYRDRLARAVRIERRRRRVGQLLGWRWLSLAAGLTALGVAVVPAISPDVSLHTTGDAIAAIWSKIPAHELISGSIDGIGSAIATILAAMGPDVRGWAAEAGPTLLGALVPIVLTFAIYSRGVGSWQSSDAAERRLIRREAFGPAGSSAAKSEAFLLVGGLASLVAASADQPLATAVILVVTAVLAAIVRWA